MRNSGLTEVIAKTCLLNLEWPLVSRLVRYFLGRALFDSAHPRILTRGSEEKTKAIWRTASFHCKIA
jgi:hypothetical protein